MLALFCQKARCMQQRSPSPDFGAAVKGARFALHWRQFERPCLSVNGECCVNVKYVIGTTCQEDWRARLVWILCISQQRERYVFLLTFSLDRGTSVVQ